MFLWTWRQVVFFLVMLAVITAVLAHPAWHRRYELIFTSVWVIIAILCLRYVLRKP